MRHLQTKGFYLALALLLPLVAAESTAQEGAVAFASVTDTIPGTSVTFTMVHLPGGSFAIGTAESESGRDEDEGPMVQVEVAGFYMGIHEVTYDEFALFKSRDSDTEASAPGTDFDPDLVARPSPPYEDPAHGMGSIGHPAVGMTQWSALQYARWLSEKTGRFYRLPTEAEWEYACRAGTTTAFGFGDDPADLDGFAWHYGNSGEAYHKVGEKAANAWGLFDMHGNVAEWTLDQYDAAFYAGLEGDPTVDPWSMPSRLHPRTVRGGAYDDDPEALRCGSRLESTLRWKRRDPQIPRSMWWNTDSPFVGFRIMRPASEPSSEEQEIFWMTVLGG